MNETLFICLGMLKHKDGYVLKPIEKPACGEREIDFYQDLQYATDPVSVELKKLVPKYLGNTTLQINEKGKTFLKSSVKLPFPPPFWLHLSTIIPFTQVKEHESRCSTLYKNCGYCDSF